MPSQAVTSPPTSHPEYLLPPETAEVLRTSEHALANLRHRGVGPPYLKVGGRILYPKAPLFRWLDSCAVETR